MDTRSSWMGGSLLVALVVGLLTMPEAAAKGPRGGHSGGRPARAPRVSAAHRANKAPASKPPRMPHASTPARAKPTQTHARTNNTQANSNHAATSATHRATSGTANASTNAASATHRATTTTGTANASTNAGVNPTHTTSTSSSPYNYTYGQGTGARRYRAHGYGRGYRNRYYGGGYGYGRSQAYNRAIVSRLRSVHASLARINQNYQGHRVRAMHAISMAVRQLTHRSMVYNGVGFALGMNNGRAMGMRQGGVGAGARRPQAMTQAQADTRMGQALRSLQGINMQLSSQGYSTTGHARARGHVRRAIRELNTALAIR